MLTIGTETSGSIISPSQAQTASSACGPTVGLVPGYGIAPDLRLAGHGRPDGPHGRQRGADAAVDRRARPRRASYARHLGPRRRTGRPASSRRCPRPCPNYMSALDLNFVAGQAHRLQRHARRRARPLKLAYDALVAAGAIMVPRPQIDRRRRCPALPGGYEQHQDDRRTTTSTSARSRRSSSLVEEVADNQAERAAGAEVRQRQRTSTRPRSTSRPVGANEIAVPRRTCRRRQGRTGTRRSTT